MKIDELFETYKALVVSAEYEKALYNGNKLPIQLLIDKGYKVIENERYRVYDSNKRFIGLYKIVDRVDEEKIIKILKVDKMFY
jgi:tRNA pseudouridine55 synthase